MSTPAMHLEAAGEAPDTRVACDECSSLFAPKREWSRFCTRQCRNTFHGRERRRKLIEARALVMFEALTQIARETGTPYATEAAKAIEGLKAP